MGDKVMNVWRGDIWEANIPQTDKNSKIIHGTHPVIITSNWMANKNGNVVAVVPVSSSKTATLPTHVDLSDEKFFGRDCIALGEIQMPLDKFNLKKRTGYISEWKMLEIMNATMIHVGIGKQYTNEQIKEVRQYIEILDELGNYLKENYDEDVIKRKRHYYKAYERYCNNNNLPVNFKKYEVKESGLQYKKSI